MRSMNIKGGAACKPGGVPSQMTGRTAPTKPSTRPGKADHKGAMVQGPYGGKKSA